MLLLLLLLLLLLPSPLLLLVVVAMPLPQLLLPPPKSWRRASVAAPHLSPETLAAAANPCPLGILERSQCAYRLHSIFISGHTKPITLLR